jgi:hypothetical protein
MKIVGEEVMKALQGRLALAVLAMVLLAAGSTPAPEARLGKLFSGGSLDEKTVAAGLKEALQVGTERTVLKTSKVDGFLGNALIRIALPKSYEKVADTLRKLGLKKEVEELEVGMNRAAERAAGEALPIFSDAIKKMTLPDAVKILRGGNTAATEYFRARTSEALRAKFLPIVTESLDKVGAAQQYDRLARQYDQLPVVTRPALNLDDYVTDRALSGLFTVLGQEEKRIRKHPSARTTDLLKQVFGR